MSTRMTKQSGFSLVELMIVVAIIGILATIAVPNFNRFSGKAKQSEAKGSLASLYTAEKAFFAEWSSYIGDLRDAGYAPEGKMNYRVGFGAVGVSSVPTYTNVTKASRLHADIVAGGCPSNLDYYAGPDNACFNVSLTPSATTSPGFPAGFTAAQTTFLAGAEANFGAAVIDAWRITENKSLTQDTDGLN